MLRMFQYSLWNLGVVNHPTRRFGHVQGSLFQYSLWNLGVVNLMAASLMAASLRVSVFSVESWGGEPI